MRGRGLEDPAGKASSEITASISGGSIGPVEGHQGRLFREIVSLALLGVSIYILLSFLSLELGQETNLGGPVGALVANSLIAAFGHLGVLPILGCALFAWVWFCRGGSLPFARLLSGFASLVVVACALAGAISEGVAAGGALGHAISAFLTNYFSFAGTAVILVTVGLSSLALMFNVAPSDLVVYAGRLFKKDRSANIDSSEESQLRAYTAGKATSEILLTEEAIVSGEADEEESRKSGSAESSRQAIVLNTASSKSVSSAPSPPSRSQAKLPPLSLLDKPPTSSGGVDKAVLEQSARVLEQKLADFGVMGRVVEVEPGPVISMYKFEPASGVKVSQVVNLADDLSLALKAPSIRIQAPVPGEAVIGIEVPNRKREKIYLREILEAPEFRAAGSQLTIALGKTISGQPAVADLAKMPHLLIAGATGAGKSVALHAMIASILFNATAEDVRFILIDPKMLELSVYEGIPHLLVPVVVDPDKAAAALLWATQEMERRYRVMRELGVRNIDGYNEALRSGASIISYSSREGNPDGSTSQNGDGKPPIEHRKLPKIVIVIDELADLMLTEGKSVERDITRLAQKARASGIHLILATQRPSVDIITGLIKANMPARISFQVASRVDSRTILDSIGAERLLGEGDMLFLPPGGGRLRRMHAPFVSEGEIRKVTDFLRRQGAPDYQMDILETKRVDQSGADGNYEKDEMYDEAVRIVTETNQASISLIQRRLRIGYNRAARIVEQMEREGIVSPADGLRPREVRTVRIVR